MRFPRFARSKPPRRPRVAAMRLWISVALLFLLPTGANSQDVESVALGAKPSDTLEGQFESAKAAVLAHKSGAQLISEGAVQMSLGGQQRIGRHATFTYVGEFASQRQPVRSELYLFTHGRWFIKYRVTYPVGQQTVAEPASRAFINELGWP